MTPDDIVRLNLTAQSLTRVAQQRSRIVNLTGTLDRHQRTMRGVAGLDRAFRGVGTLQAAGLQRQVRQTGFTSGFQRRFRESVGIMGIPRGYLGGPGATMGLRRYFRDEPGHAGLARAVRDVGQANALSARFRQVGTLGLQSAFRDIGTTSGLQRAFRNAVQSYSFGAKFGKIGPLGIRAAFPKGATFGLQPHTLRMLEQAQSPQVQAAFRTLDQKFDLDLGRRDLDGALEALRERQRRERETQSAAEREQTERELRMVVAMEATADFLRAENDYREGTKSRQVLLLRLAIATFAVGAIGTAAAILSLIMVLNGGAPERAKSPRPAKSAPSKPTPIHAPDFRRPGSR